MAASFNDMSNLRGDSTFQGRVLSALAQTCVNIQNEGGAVSNHLVRRNYGQTVMNNPTFYQPFFVLAVSVDTNVIADATANGTVAVTGANAASQAALVTDTHISSAISSSFNTFVPGITI